MWAPRAELRVLIPVKQMHTDMGDKRGVRPRRICHGDAPSFEDHGCRPGVFACTAEARKLGLPDPLSLSIDRSSVYAASRVFVLTSPYTKHWTGERKPGGGGCRFMFFREPASPSCHFWDGPPRGLADDAAARLGRPRQAAT